MTVIGSRLRLAGTAVRLAGTAVRLASTTLLVVAVAACGGLDRNGRGTDPATGADGDPAGSSSIDGLAAELGQDVVDGDVSLEAELDALLGDAEAIDPDVDLGLVGVTGADPSASSPTSGGGTASTPAALPSFDAGSFAGLDAALSTLDLALGAGAAGSEGNLP